MIIKTNNNLNVNVPMTYLTNPEVSGTTVFRVKNTTGFDNTSWAVQVGQTGEEQTEVLLLSGNPGIGTSMTSTAISLFDHPSDTPIYAIKYDQVVFERSTTGTGGVATPMTGGTITYQADNTFTQFDDTSGTTGYAYKTYFRNSVLLVNSTESDWITPTGFSFYSLAKMRQRTKDKLTSSAFITDDSVIDDWLNEWLEIMTNSAIDVNEDYALGTVDIAFSNNTELGTITATDFKQLRRVWYIDGSGTYPMTKMDITNYQPDQIFTVIKPYFYMQGDTIIGRRPSDSSGTARCTYYKLNPVLVNDTDEVPTPMKGYTNSFVNYAQAQAYRKDSKPQADQQEASALRELGRFKSELSPRNKTGADYVSIVEDMNADDGGWVW